MQEDVDLHTQARWKLEKAVDGAVSAKRWDAAGVAAFALGELLGGDDAVAAVGALMLHQVRWQSESRRAYVAACGFHGAILVYFSRWRRWL